MKNKILLPILLLASMSVVACNPGNNGSQSQGSSENTQISSEEPTTSSQQEQPSSQQGTTSSQQPGTSSQQGGQSSSQAPSSSKGGSSSSQTPSSNPVVYGVKILNKDQLTGDWYKGTTRDLNIELSPAANALLEMQKKNLTVTSSDTSKVAVTGLGLTAVGKGQVTITVKYHEAVDTVTVNILSNSAIDKYGTAHEGTLEDPFTNEDAIKVTKASNYEGEDYYIKGKVASFYHAPGVKKGDKYVYGRTDGACSYFLEPATAGGEQFEVYKCYKEGSGEASYLTEDDIWVGGEAVAHGKLTKYNAQCETSAAIYANCTGNKPASRQIVTKEFANVIADGNKLADGGDSYDFWKFQGYVNTRSGNDYYLTATKGEELTTDTFKTKAIQLYFYEPASAEIAGKLLDGAKVEVTMIVKNYHSQMENLLPLESSDITVVEAGEEWKVPEPKVNARSLADFIAGENTKAVAYFVTAQIKSFKDGESKDKYGNMYLTDGTNDLQIYGSTYTASALAWNNVNSYSFTNPQDFLTNEKSSALKVGDTITMKLIRADYTKDDKTTIEASGIILEGESSIVPEPKVEERSLADFIAGENTKAVAYFVTAQIKSWKDATSAKDKYGNMFLTDGTNDLQIYGSSATASALKWNDEDAYVFTNPQDFLGNATTAALNIGDTVTMKLIRADFTKDGKTTIEATGIIVTDDGGQTENVPEPTVATKSLADFIAGENTAAVAYTVTAKVKSWKNATSEKDKYGNMYLTDGTNDLQIYGSSATASALTWNNVDSYVFSNPQDFLTNATTVALNIGDTVTMKLIRADYTKDGKTTIEATGIITKVEAEDGGGSQQEEINYGTEQAPLTIAEAKAIAAAKLGTTNSYTESMLWVKAYVTNVPTVNGEYGWKNIYLGDTNNAAQANCILAYSVNKSATCAKLAQNDFVVIHGALKNFAGTIEFTNVKDGDTTIHGYPEFSNRVAGTSTITVTGAENATIDGLPAAAKNDATVYFTVTPKEGYKVAAVSVNNTPLTENAGQYSFVVAGNATVAVTIQSQDDQSSIVTTTKTVSQLAQELSWTASAGSEINGCYTNFNLDQNVQISTSGQANCGSMWGTSPNNDWRLYQNKGGDLTITPLNGVKITSITLTFTISNTGCLATSSGTGKTADFTSDTAKTVSLTEAQTWFVANTASANNGQVRISAFSVTYVIEK